MKLTLRALILTFLTTMMMGMPCMAQDTEPPFTWQGKGIVSFISEGGTEEIDFQFELSVDEQGMVKGQTSNQEGTSYIKHVFYTDTKAYDYPGFFSRNLVVVLIINEYGSSPTLAVLNGRLLVDKFFYGEVMLARYEEGSDIAKALGVGDPQATWMEADEFPSNVQSALQQCIPFGTVKIEGDYKTVVSEESKEKEEGFVWLFPKDGSPEGWLVRTWSDVNKPAEPEAKWVVKDGILNGSTRGTWLISKRQFSDFILKFDFKLGPTGNSGCALRAPLFGDPAFDGMELQMADYRYNTAAKDSELTGGIYRAIAPIKQVYKPTQWNNYVITLKGSRLHVILNGVVIHDLNLNEQNQLVLRHNGQPAPPVKDRPRKGHIGFQELSRGAEHVQIRNARIKVLD